MDLDRGDGCRGQSQAPESSPYELQSPRLCLCVCIPRTLALFWPVIGCLSRVQQINK